MISMNKTYTPELTPDVLERLRDYAEFFRDDFRYKTQHSWSGVYLRGLLQNGERKSIEPMVDRVPRPPELLDIQDPEQALQQFLNQSPWDDQKVCQRSRRVMAGALAHPRGIFVIDDTGFPKQGTHSVGVQRQYCGQLGKKASCQVAVTVHYVAPRGHFPVALRLYLPQSWTSSPQRLEAVGVPEPYRRERTKGQIALDLLDQVRAEQLLPGNVVITDAGYGVSQSFRDGLEQRQVFYIAGVTPEMVVFTAEPRWVWPAGQPTGGRPRSRPHLAEDNPRPVSLKSLAESLPRRKVTWREGTKGKLSAKFAWVRVWPGQGWAEGACAGADALWLLIEERADGKIQYAFANLPACTRRIQAVRLWKSRWPVEQGYQQMKEELGLNHFEGRSWRGFHHHACLVMLSYGFLVLEQLRAKESPVQPGKKRQHAAQDHRPGDSPRLAATASADGSAGLCLL
ncbi:MAG: IS701 family transposase [Planctomycetaceae bacterium]|nr:IS701 family transposase [Planctomycetaceae bacterium]MBV8381436.1 IS701 family transposase [Planctomycetaceae bacterium]